MNGRLNLNFIIPINYTSGSAHASYLKNAKYCLLIKQVCFEAMIKITNKRHVPVSSRTTNLICVYVFEFYVYLALVYNSRKVFL